MKRTLWLCAMAFVCLPSWAADSIAKVNYVQLAVSHAGEAGKWYAEHFDCVPVEGRTKAILCDDMTLEFVERASVGSSQGTGINHIGFSYANLKAKMATLEAVGVRGSGVRLQRFDDGSTLQLSADGVLRGFVFDPWGTRIELVEDPHNTGFHHVHLNSADPVAALAWYAESFGGTSAKYREGLAGVRFDDTWLFADQYGDGKPASTRERAIDHIGFAMTGLDAVAVELRRRGAKMHDPAVPENARSKAKKAMVAGPDGVRLALVEPGWAGVAEAVRDEAVVEAVAAKPYNVPKTPWGEPDMQGIWTGNAAHGIPLEKPEDEAGNAPLTASEAAARRERGTLGSIWGYEREWRDTTLGYDKKAPSTQVAMIIDPPTGRLPPMTEKGETLAAAALDRRANPQLAAGPEDLTNYVRCITRGLPALMMPSIYNNGLQIAQSPGYVAIQKEMIHETRVIPTAEREHLDAGIKQWLGSSRGHWEGATFVVEVKGFNGRAAYRGAGENMTLTERYTRVSENRLRYEFTVDDPTIWTQPWTGMFHFDKDDGQYELVEYACHEGNYGMTNILSAARARDAEKAENARQSSKPYGN